MSIDQINIAIAESMGWVKVENSRASLAPKEFRIDSAGEAWTSLQLAMPDYRNDLNAMHEAEKVLDMHQQYDYGEALARMRIGAEFDDPEGFSPNGWGYYSPITATAAQRAEAYLKTIGKWQQETSREDGTKYNGR